MYIGTLLKEENPRSNKYIYIVALAFMVQGVSCETISPRNGCITRLEQWDYQCHVNKKGEIHKAPPLDKELPATNAR